MFGIKEERLMGDKAGHDEIMKSLMISARAMLCYKLELPSSFSWLTDMLVSASSALLFLFFPHQIALADKAHLF